MHTPATRTTDTRAHFLCFSSLPWMVGVHSTTFPANISSFFFEGGIIQWSEGQGKPGLRMEKNRSCWQRWRRRKRKGGEGRGKSKGGKRRGEERSHIILHRNGNAITSHLIRTVRSTLASDLLAFISNMNYGSALASKC